MSTPKLTETHNLVAFLKKPIESEGFEKIIDFLNASYVKNVNGKAQIQALVDKKKVIITEVSIRRNLRFEDEGGVDCLSNEVIFEQLTLMSGVMASAIICLATNQNFNFSKYIFDNMVKHLDGVVKFLMYPRFVQVFLDNQVEGMDRDDAVLLFPLIQRSKIPNEEGVPTTSNNPLPSGEDRMQLNELIILCTNLQKQVLDLEEAKTAQAKEIASLKKRVKKLEQKKKSRTSRLKRLRKVGTAMRVESLTEASLGDQEDASKQGLITLIKIGFSASVDVKQSVKVVKNEVNTTDPVTTAGEVVTTAGQRKKRIVMQDPSETTSSKPIYSSQKSSHTKDKGKGKMVEPEKPLKRKDQIMIDEEFAKNLEARMQAELEEEERLARLQEKETNIAFINSQDNTQAMMDADCELAMLFNNIIKWKEAFVPMNAELVKDSDKAVKDSKKAVEGGEKAKKGSSKRAGSNLEQEDAKRQRLEEENEFAKLKRCLETMFEDDDDVTIKATPLSSKSLTIVDYKIYKEGKKSFFKIIRADARFRKTKPIDDMDNLLFQTLKTIFEHHVEDNIWKYQQGSVKVLNWKLLDSCGVYCITTKNMVYYLLVEKMYPFTRNFLHQMWNDVRLQVDYEVEMAYDLLRLIRKQINEGYVLE
nr:hypothetical protein [Tanacetum cinerariifolium]